LAGGGPARTIEFVAPVTAVTPRYRKRSRDFTSATRRPVVGIGSPTLSPDGRQVAFRALNDLYTMGIGHPPVPLTGDTRWKADLVGGRRDDRARRDQAVLGPLPRGPEQDPAGGPGHRRGHLRRPAAGPVDPDPRRRRAGVVAGRHDDGLRRRQRAVGHAGAPG